MNQPLPPYLDYKPAGLPWLEQVPAHWEIKRNKYLFQERDTRSQTGTEELLTVSQYTGITKRADRRKHDAELLTTAASLIGYKNVSKSDLVINIMLAWNGSLGTSDFDGIVSPAYCVYRATSKNNPHYFHYLFRTPLYKAMYKAASTGVVDSRLRLYSDKFFALPALLPPLAEQRQIVAFLDAKGRQVARLLRAKRQLIKLLQEQKQNVMQKAVLYGLHEEVSLKPSGVEWFTTVPAHWSVKKLKHLATVRSGIAKGKTYLSGQELIEVPYLRVANVQDGFLRLGDMSSIQVTKSEAQSYKLEPFDLLMNEGGDIDKLGRGTVWHGEIPNCINQNHVFALRPKKGTNVYFLNYFVGAPACKKYFEQKGKQTTNLASISASAIAATPIALPPLDEQEAIVEYIDRESRLIDETISRAQREIELIQEYRTRLVADVVTGQVDVRGLTIAAGGADDSAPGLPDEEEVAEEELLEETAETDG
jgi:type I restriction enzyme S subunit